MGFAPTSRYYRVMSNQSLERAYAHCLTIARGHYENFPVASYLLPRHLRQPIAAIYAFARGADDIADEGAAPPEARLAELEVWRQRLEAISAGEAMEEPVFIALADTITRHHLPLQPFFDLLKAFGHDVRVKRYGNFDALLNYCRHSADPVGRLLLHLYGEASERNLADSDKICTALQLINFYQDLKQDYAENGRIYIPEDEMRRFGVSEAHFQQALGDAAMAELFQHQLRRARALLLAGAPLGGRLKGRFGLEIRLIVQGGLRVLAHLEAHKASPFARPRLRPLDIWLMLYAAVLHRLPAA